MSVILKIFTKVKSNNRPPSGGFYNEVAKSMTSLCSANNLAEFIMSLQNL
jgi:hypothetical protein